MTNNDCESIRIAAMALADGEESSLSTKQIESHVFNCDACREEIEQLRVTTELLSSHRRLNPNVNVWPMVNERIEAASAGTQQFRWRLLLLFGIPLFGYKLLMLNLAAPSLWSRLVPIVLAIAIFGYLKTNPFKINTELRLEGEWPS